MITLTHKTGRILHLTQVYPTPSGDMVRVHFEDWASLELWQLSKEANMPPKTFSVEITAQDYASTTAVGSTVGEVVYTAAASLAMAALGNGWKIIVM